MLQDAQAIRHYQYITDALNEQWNRGYRIEELRLYLDGYLAALRHSSAIEPYLIYQVEEAATRYLFDYSNFAVAEPQPEPETNYYRY